MKVVDRPGRYIALIFLAPFLLYSGITIRHDYNLIGLIQILIAIILFMYELFWVSRSKAEITYI